MARREPIPATCPIASTPMDIAAYQQAAARRRALDLERWQREAEAAAASRAPRRCWLVTTSGGSARVVAGTMGDAIATGLELTGPRATLVSCLQEGDW